MRLDWHAMPLYKDGLCRRMMSGRLASAGRRCSAPLCTFGPFAYWRAPVYFAKTRIGIAGETIEGHPIALEKAQ